MAHRSAIFRRVESLGAKSSTKRTTAETTKPRFAPDSSVSTPSTSNKRRKTNPVRGSIPNAPSEEPTPSIHNSGKYTQGDVNYMVKLFAYELNKDSTATRAEICAKLGKKVCPSPTKTIHDRLLCIVSCPFVSHPRRHNTALHLGKTTPFNSS